MGAGEAPGDDPRPRHERAADGRAEAAPARGRRAGRRGLLRGDRLELPVARGRAQAAAGRARRAAAQPALGGPLGDAHDAARLAADLGAPQRRARARGRAALRGGRGLLRPPARARADGGRAALDPAAGRADAPRRADDRAAAAGVLGRQRAAGSRLLRRQGRARGAAARAARAVQRRSAAPTRSCTRAARRACSSAARTPAGSASSTRAWPSEWDLGRVAGFELDLSVVLPHAVVAPHYEDLTSFPAIRQDLAFWIPADRTAAELVEVVRGAGGKLLRDVRVFDVYAREGQTSLAVRLEFRARTAR